MTSRFKTLLFALNFFTIIGLTAPSVMAQTATEQAKIELEARMQAEKADFEDWLYTDAYAYAIKNGITKATLDRYLPTIEFNDKSFMRDNTKVESKSDFNYDDYYNMFITDAALRRGQRMMIKYADVLERAQNEYGVEPEYIVALWSIESRFGDIKGSYRILDATATIAKTTDPNKKAQRSREFYQYFTDALRLVQDGDMPEDQTGGYVGAGGHVQFMPSNIVRYAVDGDGDGRRDIFNSVEDAIMSAGNFLKVNCGWVEGQRVGRRVLIPGDKIDISYHGKNAERSLQEWRDMGLTMENGEPIPVSAGMTGYLMAPDYRHYKPRDQRKHVKHLTNDWYVYLFYDNADAIMNWNRSAYFGGAVLEFGNRLMALGR